MSEQTDQQDEGMLPLERRTYLMGLASGATATGVAGGAAAASGGSGVGTDDAHESDSWIGYGSGPFAEGVYGDISPPSIPGGEGTPNDEDGDGLYEDVNGDGEFNIFDVQALFENLENEAAQGYAPYFDFAGNGRLSVFDVQALYTKLQNQN